MNEFKFKLTDRVVQSGKDKPLVIIGKAMYINGQEMYMCQNELNYINDGFSFLKCEWHNVNELKLVK
jgi:hypothetical protein